MSTALTPTATHPLNTAQALDALADFSALSPAAALARPLAELVDFALAAISHSGHTRRAYRTAIGLFLQHLDNTEGDKLPPHTWDAWRPFAETHKEGRRTVWSFRPPSGVLRLVTPSALVGFERWLVETGNGEESATIRGYMIRSFLAVALVEGALHPDQAQAMGIKPYRPRKRRDAQPVGRRLGKEEVKTLRASIDTTTAKGARDLAILDAMLYLGLRSEEVAGLDLADFRQDGGRWWIIVKGKGGKTRRLKIPDPFYRSLTAWLAVATLGTLGAVGPVFGSINKGGALSGNPINTATIRRLVAEYGERANLAPLQGTHRLSPHDLRRTSARNAYDNGAPLLMIQTMLGHSDPKTTAGYIGAFDNDENTAIDYVRY